MFILVFSKLGSWKLNNWVPFISLEVTKLNEAVNANRLVPRVCLWLSRSMKCFPSWQMLWSRKGSGKYTIREGLLCCGDGKDFSAVEMRSTYYPRYSSGQAFPKEGRNVCHRKCGFLSYDYRCNYNPKASCGQGKLILILQQYGCTLCRTG